MEKFHERFIKKVNLHVKKKKAPLTSKNV